jgi:TonB family protein
MQAAFLISLIVKATVLVVGAWACARLLSQSSAAARSAAWASGLILAVALPFAMVFAPSWSVNAPPLMAVGAIVSDQEISQSAGRRDSAPSASSAQVSRAANALPRLDATGVSTVMGLIVPALWLLGTAVALVRLGGGLVANLRIRRAAEPLDDPAWTAVVAEGCGQVGLQHPPPIRISQTIAVPAVSGVLKPALLLPPDAREWSDSCRQVVVLHELSHLKRRDCLVQLLSDVARAFYWFHPMIHKAAARLRDEREQACDDVVIAAGTSPTLYADHLLDLVRAGMKLPPAPAVAFGTPARLHDRILSILDDRRCRTARNGRIAAVAMSAGAIVLVLLGGVRVNAQPPLAGHRGDHGAGVVTRVITADTRQRVADALAVALRDGNSEVRGDASAAIEAIQALGEAPLSVQAPCRGNCINWDVVSDAVAKAMQGLIDEAAVLQLASDHVEARRAAVGRVWPRTQRGAAALARALLDDDRIVRNGAAIRLDSIHAPVAVPNWIVLLGDTDPMLRERAAISLGVIGDLRAIDPLAEALRDPETPVRLQAVHALAAIALGYIAVPAMAASGGLQVRTVYRPENGVSLPEVVREAKPRYTPEALQARIQGRVMMRAVVEADGSVKDVEVVESLDQEYGLDNQATAALKQYEFKPGLWMGAAVPVLITVEMRFALK